MLNEKCECCKDCRRKLGKLNDVCSFEKWTIFGLEEKGIQLIRKVLQDEICKGRGWENSTWFAWNIRKCRGEEETGDEVFW